jgi:hypothetical protein
VLQYASASSILSEFTVHAHAAGNGSSDTWQQQNVCFRCYCHCFAEVKSRHAYFFDESQEADGACKLPADYIGPEVTIVPLLQVLPETLGTKADEVQEKIIAVVAGTIPCCTCVKVRKNTPKHHCVDILGVHVCAHG